MSVREPRNQSQADIDQFAAVQDAFEKAAGSVAEKLDSFPKFASRQAMAKFLARYEIFKQILDVNGSIVECGVLHGGGLLTFAKLSAIFEPVNHTRRIFGFDTFAGFPSVHEKDRPEVGSAHLEVGGLTGSSREDVERSIELFDLNRPLAHIDKVQLIEGDLCETAPAFVKDNPHLVVALLYLDVDLFEPTRVALETFVPRMPKGGIIVFDELNAEIFPGETTAVQDVLGLNSVRIRRYPTDPYISYCVIE